MACWICGEQCADDTCRDFQAQAYAGAMRDERQRAIAAFRREQAAHGNPVAPGEDVDVSDFCADDCDSTIDPAVHRAIAHRTTARIRAFMRVRRAARVT